MDLNEPRPAARRPCLLPPRFNCDRTAKIPQERILADSSKPSPRNLRSARLNVQPCSLNAGRRFCLFPVIPRKSPSWESTGHSGHEMKNHQSLSLSNSCAGRNRFEHTLMRLVAIDDLDNGDAEGRAGMDSAVPSHFRSHAARRRLHTPQTEIASNLSESSVGIDLKRQTCVPTRRGCTTRTNLAWSRDSGERSWQNCSDPL